MGGDGLDQIEVTEVEPRGKRALGARNKRLFKKGFLIYTNKQTNVTEFAGGPVTCSFFYPTLLSLRTFARHRGKGSLLPAYASSRDTPGVATPNKLLHKQTNKQTNDNKKKTT